MMSRSQLWQELGEYSGGGGQVQSPEMEGARCVLELERGALWGLENNSKQAIHNVDREGVAPTAVGEPLPRI